MLQFDEYKVKLNNLAPTLEELGKALDLESAERELDMLQAESAADGFWNNLEKAQKVQQRIKNLQDKVDKQNKRRREWDDLMALCEMGNEFEDESLLPELEEGFAQLERDMEEARLQTLLTGEYDSSNVILTIHPGAGGALRPRTGPRCSTACTPAGPSATALPIRSWTTRRGTRRASSRLPSWWRGRTPTAT